MTVTKPEMRTVAVSIARAMPLCEERRLIRLTLREDPLWALDMAEEWGAIIVPDHPLLPAARAMLAAMSQEAQS